MHSERTISFCVFYMKTHESSGENEAISGKAVAIAFVPDISSFKMNSEYSGATAIGGMLRSAASL
ncbi:hypothetical protein C7121_14735 [Paenibacillus glucanolyticus]|jgi:hypothetical protein|nr:hypothetical protein A3958_01800 [Paenibacillus glucanolyticus]AVV57279.1 hypothetical protein C7121_14735 [Paenibacillus glucanolyticus]ETT32505.1 hypothetical protein C169_23205 [Paenibacillus sp. FSL R5-808]OMF71369.1 hypothetical protein BK142_22325 [Paenibacillus glucanolyticus]